MGQPPNRPESALIPWAKKAGDHIDKYTVCRLLGMGTDSIVYEVKDEQVGTHFALKMMRSPLAANGNNPVSIERFHHSIQAHSMLRGVLNVVHLAGHGTFLTPQGAYPYLVMELVPRGESITAWAAHTNPSLASLVEVFERIAMAVGAMADMKICHRDLKPENILIGPEDVPMIIDLNSASIPTGEMITAPAASAIPGTPAYFSPELAAAVLEEITTGKKARYAYAPTDDLYSMGFVFYEVLVGDVPACGPNDAPETILRRITSWEPVFLTDLEVPVPLSITKVVMKLLNKNPAERYQSGYDVVKELVVARRRTVEDHWFEPFMVPRRPPSPTFPGWLDPDPSAAIAPSPPARLRWKKRTRRAVVAIGGLALTAVFVWSVVRGVSRSTLPARATPPVAAAPLEQLFTPIPAQGHNVVVTPPSDTAPGEHSALPAIVATKRARIPSAVTAPPTERRGDGAVSLSDDSEKSTGPVRDELATAKSSFEIMAAKYVKVSGEELSPQHAWATLFATDNAPLTHFDQVSRRRLTVNGGSIDLVVWMDDDSGTVAVVVDLPNPDDAPPWEPLEGRIISDARSSSESPVALRAMPRVIPPGERGRVALVFNRSAIQDKAMVEILRDARPDFGIEISSQELEQRNSRWRTLWPLGER